MRIHMCHNDQTPHPELGGLRLLAMHDRASPALSASNTHNEGKTHDRRHRPRPTRDRLRQGAANPQKLRHRTVRNQNHDHKRWTGVQAGISRWSGVADVGEYSTVFLLRRREETQETIPTERRRSYVSTSRVQEGNAT